MGEADTLSFYAMLYQYATSIIEQLFRAAIRFTARGFLYNTISRWFVRGAWSESDARFIYESSELLTTEGRIIIEQDLHWDAMFDKT